TSEDSKELKDVHLRLLECYHHSYLDLLPDMEPKQQVNRIVKNMIEYVFFCYYYYCYFGGASCAHCFF
ncbi:hypothetical protein PILCRDRAFT_76951, partial [Piloderma croceum F 1598]